MEGEKTEVVFHMLVGGLYRKQTFKSTINIIFVILAHLYYWGISVIATLFASEVGRFMTRSPAIMLLMRVHHKTYIDKLVAAEEAIVRRAVFKGLLGGERSTPEPVVVNQTNQATNTGEKAGLDESPRKARDTPQAPKEEFVNQKQSNSHDNMFHSLELEIPGEETNKKQVEPFEFGSLPSVPVEDLAATPLPSAFTGLFTEADDLPEFDTTKGKRKVTFADDVLQRDPARVLETQKAYLASILPSRTTVVKSAQAEHLKAFKQLVSNPKECIAEDVTEHFERLALVLPPEHKAGLEAPEPFLPEAKDVMDLQAHKLAALAFLVEENSIPSNIAYRFASFFSLFRCMLLSLITIRVTGRPAVQLTLGLVVECAMLLFMKIAHCKASKREYYAELAMQVLRVVFLLFKLLSTFDSIGGEAKQVYLGAPMAVFIVLICLINILFLLFTIGEMLWETVTACWLWVKASRQ